MHIWAFAPFTNIVTSRYMLSVRPTLLLTFSSKISFQRKVSNNLFGNSKFTKMGFIQESSEVKDFRISIHFVVRKIKNKRIINGNIE